LNATSDGANLVIRQQLVIWGRQKPLSERFENITFFPSLGTSQLHV